MLGIPVLIRNTNHQVGAWLRDSRPPLGTNPSIQWVTAGETGSTLREYPSESALKSNNVDAVYSLKMPFEGTGHLIYNHSLYYQQQGTWKMVRFDLHQRQVIAVNSVHPHGTRYYGMERLFKDRTGAIKFMADETGMWILYATHRDPLRMDSLDGDWNNQDVMFLAKIDPQWMQIEKEFKLKVPMSYRGNGFMVCGTLYLVRTSTRLKTDIPWAFDAYTEREIQPQPKLHFKNPYGNCSQVQYMPGQDRILMFDSGRIVTYALRLNNNRGLQGRDASRKIHKRHGIRGGK